MASVDPDDLLREIRGERGYALSYHEMLARTDTDFLVAYRELYRQFTLVPRHLDARKRELVWTALLSSIDEFVGSVHLERAIAAGVSHDELRSAVRVGGTAAAWDAIDFAHVQWPHLLGGGPSGADEYRSVVAGARGTLTETETDFILVCVAGARMKERQFLHHVAALIDAGVPEREILESVSYIMLPTGANTFLWATDAWMEAVRSGAIPAGEVMSKVSFETRTS
jgi:alkylhydroperoxidase/carboxymuconolactone decarboxylase family protein YurZ